MNNIEVKEHNPVVPITLVQAMSTLGTYHTPFFKVIQSKYFCGVTKDNVLTICHKLAICIETCCVIDRDYAFNSIMVVPFYGEIIVKPPENK